MTKLIVFDLDGTLAKSKSPMDEEMSVLLGKLLEAHSVAVMSGGSYSQYQKQFLASLHCKKELLKKLYLFPTCSTAFYRFDNEWKEIYSEKLSKEQKETILNAFEKSLKTTGFKVANPYGEIIEDRGSQITFSALGQQAPLELKKEWDPEAKKRLKIKEELDKYLPEFEVRVGGSTSIDVTRKGIDKAYGIEQICKLLKFKKEEIVFVGDALFEGGNDYPVKSTGVKCMQVEGPEETKKIIIKLIS
jgi:hypothetical protein